MTPTNPTEQRSSLYLWPIAILASLVLLYLAKPVLVPLLFALLIAQLLSPLTTRLERYLPELMAVVVSMALLVALVVGTGVLVASQFTMLETNLPLIMQRVSAAFDHLASEVGRYFGFSQLAQRKLWLDNIGTYIGTGGLAAVSAMGVTVVALVDMALVAILTFLMLYYRRHFRRQLKKIGDRIGARSVGDALDRIVELGQNYVAGLSLVMLIVGVADTVGLLILGAPFPVLFGVLGALSVLIPYVGIVAVAPFCAVVTWLVTGSLPLGGGVLAVFAIVHFIEGNLMSPVIVGSKVNLNPLVTFIAMLAGGRLWGPAGMILFIPLAGLAKLALDAVPSLEPISRLIGPISNKDLRRRKRRPVRPVKPPLPAAESPV